MSEHVSEKPGLFSGVKDWIVVALIATAILTWGALAYFAIGDRGPAKWNYGSIKDVPGQSPHSTQTYSTDYLKK